MQRLLPSIPDLLERSKEEQFVLAVEHLWNVDRATDGEAVLVLVVSIAGSTVGNRVRIVGIHSGVLEEVVHRAMQLVGARFRRQADLTYVAAVFR